MSTIDDDRRARLPLELLRTNHASEAAAPRTAVRAVLSEDAARQRAYEALPDSPEYSSFLRGVGRSHVSVDRTVPETDRRERIAATKAQKSDSASQRRLDDFRDRFSGPYAVEGKLTSVRPMFRMNTGFNDSKMIAHESALNTICRKAGCAEAAFPARVGRPTPEQLVKVTQALIDAGKLPPGTSDSLSLRVRQMQWEWGIGVDCAGYTEGAAAAARGRPSVKPTMGDAFSGMARDRNLQKVPLHDVRPGDVIHLDPPKNERVGHNVVVYEREVADDAKRGEIAARDPAAAAFMNDAGPVQVLLVDSSWGAGDGQDYGGFRRDTWLYDTGSGRWGYFEHGSGKFETSTTGPHEEPYAGAFRPKESS